MKNKILVSSHTETGRRDRNEDCNFYAFNNSNQMLAIVCDGVGGEEDSHIASKALCDTFEQQFSKHKKIKRFPSFYNKCLKKATKIINLKSKGRTMGTTVCAVLITDNIAETANMGDSRIYYHGYKNNKWKIVSFDQNLLNHIRAKFQSQREKSPSLISVINEEEKKEIALNRKNLLALTTCIETNFKPKVNDSYYKVINDLQAGDYIHICSDGVYNWFKEDKMDKLLCGYKKDFSNITKDIVHGAYSGGSNDNMTSILIKIVDEHKK
ncbi:MAG: protein phosphatase 2C domain-containing protein [Mycoplasmoidaceae bacterium]|nr:MAG: protein phosphatase 2C domain-containing protein [Mycoplasmoidaceae bacterium]